MTRKQERRDRTANWAKAVTEGRVVTYPVLGRMTSFNSVAAAIAARDLAVEDGIEAHIVGVE